jgi:hypothetical protein
MHTDGSHKQGVNLRRRIPLHMEIVKWILCSKKRKRAHSDATAHKSRWQVNEINEVNALNEERKKLFSRSGKP